MPDTMPCCFQLYSSELVQSKSILLSNQLHNRTKTNMLITDNALDNYETNMIVLIEISLNSPIKADTSTVEVLGGARVLFPTLRGMRVFPLL